MNAVIRIPEEVGINAAAAATCVLGTVIHGLKRLANLKPRQTVLVTGAAGAVGTSALLVAKALGAQTIGTDIPEKLAEVRKSGADEAIAFSDHLSDEIKKLTAGDGVDVVLEAVGPPTFEQGMRSVRWGGKIVVIGNVAPMQAIPFLLGSIILREISILGCMNATKADVADALALMASRKLAPDIRIKFALEEAQHAHDVIRQKRSVGKVILQPNE